MDVNEQLADPAPRRVSRLGLYLPTALLLALMAGWSGFWVFSARTVGQELAKWRAAEQARGRSWTCEGQDIGGFPFRIELSCAAVALDIAAGNGGKRVTLGALTALSQIYAPRLVLVDLSSPLRVDGEATSVAWKNMRASIRLGDGLERVSIAAQDVSLANAQTSSTPAPNAEAKNLEIHLRKDPERAAAERAIDVAVRLDAARLPMIAPWLPSSADPVSLEASGVLTRAEGASGVRSLADVLEPWRLSGGAMVVDAFRLSNGAAEMTGKGQLGLDPERRPAGRLSVSAKGFAPVFARFGGGGLGQIAASLLSGPAEKPVEWPLVLQDGRIAIGPLRTPPILQPLY